MFRTISGLVFFWNRFVKRTAYYLSKSLPSASGYPGPLQGPGTPKTVAGSSRETNGGRGTASPTVRISPVTGPGWAEKRKSGAIYLESWLEGMGKGSVGACEQARKHAQDKEDLA